MRKVKVFSATVGESFGKTIENFGDNLMADILQSLFSVDPVYVEPAHAELIGVGSIIDAYYRYSRKKYAFWRKRPWRTLHVWGSGFMHAGTPALWPQRLVFDAVRGELSKARVASDRDIALGDPAILLPLIWPRKNVATSEVVVIPHFVTYQPFLERYGASLPRHWRVLNLLGDPQKICEAISASDLVISSSLHGLIVADAYGVPSIWMEPHGRIKGDGFKFADYFSFRGAPLPGPVDFESLLTAGGVDKVGNAPAVPSAETVDRLMRSFPFR
ncbi:polysaccharide pyruvyl transferase family protein [Sinorhizobium psoraleae]|uniref:Polysaccharide pyruvyl transferase family protein n=1 Tax=Sinorhizobium psoraleae TaxID=520838 RepID=A0ABT4KKM6_9HYPH|nr:polysaccharide pyruvyl transferase family protein [Sinorhizobium psoraleae]MCZ4092398.1 polysaccharide pyruvyl transferase family protein [Sinorhizobium psoraleae]